MTFTQTQIALIRMALSELKFSEEQRHAWTKAPDVQADIEDIIDQSTIELKQTIAA